ncbi:MAG: hypothetical protein KF779_05220 [Hyphomonadaceae bacterium]|nr:hypothetical protein [Hyphomonadaceae bacterium]
MAPGWTGADLVAALERAQDHISTDKVDHTALEALWAPLLLRGPRGV